LLSLQAEDLEPAASETLSEGYSFSQKLVWRLQRYSLSPTKKNKFLIPSWSPQIATNEATVFCSS